MNTGFFPCFCLIFEAGKGFILPAIKSAFYRPQGAFFTLFLCLFLMFIKYFHSRKKFLLTKTLKDFYKVMIIERKKKILDYSMDLLMKQSLRIKNFHLVFLVDTQVQTQK